MRFYKFFILTFFISSLVLGSASCKKDSGTPKDNPKDNLEQVLTLNSESATLIIGEEITLTPGFGSNAKPKRTYEWKVGNSEVVSIAVNKDNSATITAKQKGTALVSISSADGSLTALCVIIVEDGLPVDDGVVRILAIGNSFSEDAVESYLYKLAEAEGLKVVIGNMFIGGASLDLHWENASEDKGAYSYRKIGLDGNKVTTANISIAAAVADEEWDYISFQQASPYSGQYSTYTTSLPLLFNYVKEKATNPAVKYILHQTWAYAQNSTHSGFANYGNDQLTMYNAIMDAVQRASDLVPIDMVVPAGTAIQNGRTSFWGDNFCRDGYHLDLNVGRYLAACTWYEVLFGKSVIGNPYNPGSFMLSEKEMEMAQHAAHAAVLKPFEITDMTDYKTVDVGEFTTPIFIDIAQKAPVDGWNGVTSPLAGTTVPFLREKSGKLTSLSLTITERFNNINEAGEINTTTEFDMPNSVSQTNYFGNPKALFNGMIVLKSVIKIAGLDPAKSYNFCFFGSRVTGEGRQTKFISKGQNEATVNLLVGSNKSNIACTDGIKPDAEGSVYITVTAGDLNDNSTGFYHLGAMRITPQ